ncbi:uncharacterized protein [Littorina saxatilis]|uniref:Uncharacterized protein n=1 Tax=Littorina saxatilis TaxID=31220 RepID=A0AAN9GBR4_9CAEN
MSTFFMTHSDLGLPLPPFSLPPPLPLHQPMDVLGHKINFDATKSGCPGKAEDGKGRCRSPVAQPLRHRQLPASFWQEPNVPRSHPGYPFLVHPLHLQHLQALWAAGSAGTPIPGGHVLDVGGSRDSSSTGSSSKQSGHVHKEFLERLQSAQVRGYDLAASRFPITEFLFYNYGLRSYLDQTSGAGSETSSASGPGRHLHHLSRSAACPGLRPEGSTGKMAVPKFCVGQRGSPGGSPTEGVAGGGGGGGGGGGSTFPTLCPYLGYNCHNLHSPAPHTLRDCVMGQSAAAASSSSSSSSSSSVFEAMRGRDVRQPWKPAAGRTVSAYSGRYHPFA